MPIPDPQATFLENNETKVFPNIHIHVVITSRLRPLDTYCTSFPQTSRAFGQNIHPVFTPFGRKYVLTQKRDLRDLPDGHVPSNRPFRCLDVGIIASKMGEFDIVLELNIVLMSGGHTPHITLMESYTLLEI